MEFDYFLPSCLSELKLTLKRRGEVTALDIDKRMLRVVHVTSSRGSAQVRRVELLPVPSEDFDLQNPSKVGEWIGEQLKAIRLTPGTVVMAVRRGEAVLKEFQLPPLKDIGEMASMGPSPAIAAAAAAAAAEVGVEYAGLAAPARGGNWSISGTP